MAMTIDKKGCVEFAADETYRGKIGVKTMVPVKRSLFKTINCIFKLTNKLRKLRMYITRWLSHVDSFRQMTIKKGVF